MKILDYLIVIFVMTFLNLNSECGEKTTEFIEKVSSVLITNKGEKVDLSSQGEVNGFLFVAARSNCGACRSFLPTLKRYQKRLEKDKISIVIISLDSDRDKMFAYLKSYPFWIVPRDAKKVVGVRTLTGLKGYGIPYSIVTDANGKVLFHGDSGQALKTASKLVKDSLKENK